MSQIVSHDVMMSQIMSHDIMVDSVSLSEMYPLISSIQFWLRVHLCICIS